MMKGCKNLFAVGIAVSMLAACGGDSGKEDGAIDISVNNAAANAGTNVEPSGCASDADCADSADGPICDLEASACVPDEGPVTNEWDATVTEVYSPPNPVEAPDLEFHPDRNQLWVVNRRPAVEGECSQSNPGSDRCRSLAGFTTLIDNPGAGEQSVQILEDGNSWHFMRRPPALAMGDNGNFATCGEAATGNFEDNDVMFMGPSLWSTDLSIYAQPSGGNGSHLDMLHATPWCMGIAHEVGNVYWLFNGNVGSLDRYDFAEDHGPGNDDHSDGTVYRYVEGELSRVAGVPSHLVLDKDSNTLYVADTGNGRVVSIDITQGEPGSQFSPVYEPLADFGFMNNVTVNEVIPSGVLQQPSGIALADGELLVSDHATGIVHAFSLESGEETRSLDTGLGANAIAGIEWADGVLWFTHITEGKVYKAE